MPRKRLSKQALLVRANGRRPVLDDVELDEPITMRVLDGIAWDFTLSK